MKNLFMANWKMHKTIKEALSFLEEFLPLIKGIEDREIGIAPTFVCLESVSRFLENTNIKVGAQNVFYEMQGAFTGEVSPVMLKELNVDYVIVGHSERRRYFYENDEVINKKVKACLKTGLNVILCIGETLEERQQGKTFDVLHYQITSGLKEIESPHSLVIAYEPVWAIGTGVTATEQQIEEAHEFIRKELIQLYSTEGQHLRILYGGSVTEKNIYPIMNTPHVNGVLVGGASLDPLKFSRIVKFEEQKT